MSYARARHDEIFADYLPSLGGRQQPFDHDIVMRKTFTDPSKHARGRFILTYVYILLLRKTANLMGVNHALSANDVLLLHATVQARKGSGKGGTEGAHRVLREVAFNNRPVYLLEQLPQGLKGALVYCAAQVTVAPAQYNRADQLIEEPEITLLQYLSLIRDTIILPEDNEQMRSLLFSKVVRLFWEAIIRGRNYAMHLGPNSNKSNGAPLLANYDIALQNFATDQSRIVKYDTEDLMYALRARGSGWQPN